MDVLVSESILSNETRKNSLLSVFQNPRASLSFTQLFTKNKPRVAAPDSQRRTTDPSAHPDMAYITRALCGGAAGNVVKGSSFTPKGMLASEARLLLEKTAGKLTASSRAGALQIWCDLMLADQALFGNDISADAGGSDATSLSQTIKARHNWGSTCSTEEALLPTQHSSNSATEVDTIKADGHRTDSAPLAAATDLSPAAAVALTIPGKGQLLEAGQADTTPGSDSDTAAGEGGFMAARVLSGRGALELVDDAAKTAVSFRDLFLQSSALELVVKAFLEEPPCTVGEEMLLQQLLLLTLVKEPAEQVPKLVDAVTRLAGSMLHPHIRAVPRDMLRDIASQAVGSLKAHAELDKLERKMEEIHHSLEDLLQQWAAWESGSRGPAEGGLGAEVGAAAPPTEELLDSPQWKIAQQIWELASELKGVTSQRHAILEHQAAYDYSTLRRMLDEPVASMDAEAAAMQLQLEETQVQLRQGTGFRSERFGKVKGQLGGVASEITGLEGRKAELLAELEKVDEELRRLYKRQSELEEERNVFEEGSSLTLEGLAEQVQALEASQAAALMEAATLRNASALVALSAQMAAAAAGTGLKASEEAREKATEKVLAAAGRFCQLQQRELTRCLDTMKACSAMLTDITTTQMYDDILHREALEAVAARRQAAIESYLDAEMAAMGILGEVAQVQNSVRIQYASAPIRSLSRPQPPTSSTTEPAPLATPSSPDTLTTLTLTLDALRAEFEAFDRPDEVTKYSLAVATSSLRPHQSLHPSPTFDAAAHSRLSSRPSTPRANGTEPTLMIESSCEELAATCDSTISYSALMAPSESAGSDTGTAAATPAAAAGASRKAGSLLSGGSKAGGTPSPRGAAVSEEVGAAVAGDAAGDGADAAAAMAGEPSVEQIEV